MDSRVELRKRERREAYGVYVRLHWALHDLPRDHPALADLREATAHAERHWRALMQRGAGVGKRPPTESPRPSDRVIAASGSAPPPRPARVPPGAILGGALRPPPLPGGPGLFAGGRR